MPENEYSETLGKLAPALVKAQKALKNPEKNCVNPHFKNRYADLGACYDAAKDALNDEGIAVIQTFREGLAGSVAETYDKDGNVSQHVTVPATVSVTTMLLHTSGEFIRGTQTIPLDRPNAQGVGSATTYARRYGVQAILGMVAEDDDDGEAASAPVPTKKKSRLFAR